METENMKKWFVEYRKNKDLMFRKISKIELDDVVKVHMKDGSVEIGDAILTIIDGLSFLKSYTSEDLISLVLPNTTENVKLLVKNWDAIIKYKKLTLFFVNEKSFTEKKWIIKPYVHDRVTEKEALKLGIESLASNVDYC